MSIVEKFAVIGLGNPGSQYQKTRHNLGFWLLDALAERENISFKLNKKYHAEIAQMQRKESLFVLVKPLTYMNESGKFLSSLLSYTNCRPEESVVLHDEIAFPLGEAKVSRNKGAGGHNGVKSVISSIGSAFVRFRIGIGGKAHDGVDLADHVLSKISADDWSHLQSRKAFLCESLLNLLDNGVDVAMNLINQTKPAPQSL